MLKFIRAKLNTIGMALAVLSLLTVLTLVNDYAHLPQKLETRVTNALLEIHSDKGSVIIADSSTKLLFLTPNAQVTRVQDTLDFNGGADYYAAACVGPDAIYVAQYALMPDKRYLANESICKYSFAGDYLGKVMEIKHDLYEHRALQPRFTSIRFVDGKGYVTGVDTIKHKIELYSFPLTPQSKLVPAEPLLQLDPPADNKFVIEAFFLAGPNDKIAVRTYRNMLYWFAWPQLLQANADQNAVTFTGPQPCQTKELGRAMLMDAAGKIHVTTHYGSHGQTFAYSWNLALKQISFWLACCYLLVYLLCQLMLLLRKLWREGNYTVLKHLAVCTVVITFSIVIVAFYSIQLAAEQRKDMNYALRESIALLDTNSPNPLLSAVQEYQTTGTLTDTTSAKVLHVLEKAALDMSIIDQDMDFSLMAFTKSGKLVYLQDSGGDLILGTPVGQVTPSVAAAPTGLEVFIQDFNTSWGMFIYGGHYLHDEKGKRIGVIGCTYDANNFVLTTLKECGSLLLMLLSGVILAGFLLMEGNATLECALLYRQKLQEQLAHCEFYMARTYAFLVLLVGTANATLFTVLVKELTQGASEGMSAYVVAGAVSIFYFGYTVGTPLLKILNLKWPLKRVVLLSGVGMLLAYILMYYSILKTSVVLFIIGAFMINVFNQVARVYGDCLAYFAPTSSERAVCNRACSVARISGMSISTVIAGSLAQYWGNAYLELYGAAMTLLFLIFCYVIIPAEEKKIHEGVKKLATVATGEKSFGKSIYQIFHDQLSLGIIFLLLFPCYMIQAYKSYIFPLYAYGEGIDKATISNIIVFCSAIIYYCAPLLSDYEKRHGHREVIFYSGTVLAGTFLMFLIDNTLVWAIVALILSNLAYKSMEPSIKTYWQERCIFQQISAHDTQLMWSGFGTGFKTVRSGFVCTLLQVLGQALGCVALGVYVLVGTLLFTWTSQEKT